jgi:hypothetical protein
MMTKAIVSFAVGTHVEYLSIARPSFIAFAKRHGYKYCEPGSLPTMTRPPAWYKIPLMIDALKSFDEVLFLGADTLIVDGRQDMRVPYTAWQAMTTHYTNDGQVPNDDVWLVRKPMIPYLELIWTMTAYTNAPWWEQSALLNLMGYSESVRPCYLRESTELNDRTFTLDKGWNLHCRDMQPGDFHRRIEHATMYPDRAAIMRQWAAEAQEWINE